MITLQSQGMKLWKNGKHQSIGIVAAASPLNTKTMKARGHLVKIILLAGLILSVIGMHQANMAIGVSKTVFQAAHKHNWFWADGWRQLFIEAIRSPAGERNNGDITQLLVSFETAKRMTECFSSLRKLSDGFPKKEMIGNLIRNLEISRNQATRLVRVYKYYRWLLPEITLMMDNTDEGSRAGREIIDLIGSKLWRENSKRFQDAYDKMRYEEALYSERSFRITEKAYTIYVSFLISFVVFIGLFFLNIIRRNHANAQRKLMKAQDYISNIINSMPSILIGVDQEGKVTQWNKKAEESTGLKAEDANGKPILEVYPQLAPEMNHLAESISNHKVKSDLKQPHQTKNGTRYEDVTIYPLSAKGVSGAVVRIDDVTREYNLEEQLTQSRKMDAIGHLAGGIAHDFNNMLAGIMGAAQLLDSPVRNLDAKGKKYVDMILQASKRATDLTTKLLAFGRKGKRASTALDVHSILDDTVAILNRTIDKKIRISLGKDAESHIISGDGSALQNTLMNIGINAAHAMPGGGIIQIETNNIILDKTYCNASHFEIEPGRYIRIEIRDTGCGIPKQNLQKIFEPFYTTKGLGKGSGLGLAAVYGTLQEHHGAVSVHSDVGTGTAFIIFLPCSKENVTPAKIDVGVLTGSGRILLVDDEEIIRITLQHMLEEMGYQVLPAENGRVAVELFKKRHAEIDIVVMDMIMPVMSGREAFFKMKEIDKNCKVIISSGFAKKKDMDELKRFGLSGYIHKPYKNFELSQLLAQALSK
ncbi:MAG: response regulator [bacterium]|nr:response regulator [bacterium]